MKLFLLSALLTTTAQASRSEKCSSEKCCWVDIPKDYCSITLPAKPLDIYTFFNVMKFEEINEAKQSYTINLR